MLFLLEIIICSINANYITICLFRKVISESLPQMLILSCGFPCFFSYVPSHHSLSICSRHRIVVRSDVLHASCFLSHRLFWRAGYRASCLCKCPFIYPFSQRCDLFYFFYIINLRAYDQVYSRKDFCAIFGGFLTNTKPRQKFTNAWVEASCTPENYNIRFVSTYLLSTMACRLKILIGRIV